MALSPEQFALKAKNLELTFGEAIEFALSRPTVTESAKKKYPRVKVCFCKDGGTAEYSVHRST